MSYETGLLGKASSSWQCLATGAASAPCSGAPISWGRWGVCPRVAGKGLLEPASLEGGHPPVVPELHGGVMDGGRVLGADNCTEWLL